MGSASSALILEALAPSARVRLLLDRGALSPGFAVVGLALVRSVVAGLSRSRPTIAQRPVIIDQRESRSVATFIAPSGSNWLIAIDHHRPPVYKANYRYRRGMVFVGRTGYIARIDPTTSCNGGSRASAGVGRSKTVVVSAFTLNTSVGNIGVSTSFGTVLTISSAIRASVDNF